MDLPDCPPGAEGYQDSIVEMAKKPEPEESSCTKAEQEFQEHLNSLKIKLENGETRCMVERRGRDISGKWIYLCYPCGSVCSGESILQTHISGKKHKIKLSMRNAWPVSIFDDHPFNQNQKGGSSAASTATEKVLQKMAAAVEIHKSMPSEMDSKYNKYRNATCHIQDILDALKAPLVGVEYLVEHPPEKVHYEPSYICTLCTKQGHPRTIINHLTCFWHRYNYLLRHFSAACSRLGPYKGIHKYREGVSVTMHRLAQRVEDKFGRLRPVNIDKEEFEQDKEAILQWIFKGYHFSEKSGITLEEVVDTGLIESLAKSGEEGTKKSIIPINIKKRDPSPPVVAAPSKPHNARPGRKERRVSIGSLSDISDDNMDPKRPAKDNRSNIRQERKPVVDLAENIRRETENFRSRYQVKTEAEIKREERPMKLPRPPNHEYKVKLAEEKCAAVADSAASTLQYHEKNPEKHPLYPEEWKKFWNRRYKEIQAEGKDPSKHDFKPEWIVFWTKRMKELHEEELKLQVTEIYRRMNISPSDMIKREEHKTKAEKRPYPEPRRKSPEPRSKMSDHRSKYPEQKRRSPEPRRRSPEWLPRRRSRSPDSRRRSPDRRRSPEPRRRSPRRPEYRHEIRAPDPRYSIDHRKPQEVRHTPPTRTRSRSPIPRRRSPARTHFVLESARRSRSPLSQRESELRNRSPLSRRELELPHRNRSPGAARDLAPSMQTVMISDDELRPDDGLSPWNSDNEIESIASAPRSRAGSVSQRAASRARSHASHASHGAHGSHGPHGMHGSHGPYAPRAAPDLGPAENIVATLRVLVALEDYLGSIGPKIVDLLTEALKMEKERGNSSEELLERESAVVLIETAKEKLKGAAQAGLVPACAAPALRAAVLRAAATLHEADTRARSKPHHKKPEPTKAEAMPVAGVGEVDRAQIAQQMAAALIAQGKTDVTSEELAQLVDAVVGMAEAKKREAEATKKVEVKVAPAPAPPVRAPAKLSGTATALQMLQSAYDENDKKIDKEDAPDAMDGLSDSDLETLLKNFNELSAEEQHSLIAYLKKLEAREPQRVERLRQYVSAAATSTQPAADDVTEKETAPVAIESDDDDYTVEDVFKSATQKVKEDQIRKELDIVKKSLEGPKEEDDDVPLPPVKAIPIVDLSKHLSSASDLFALVQASIKSTSVATPAGSGQPDVVSSSAQPRSFGDVPEKPIESLAKPRDSPRDSPMLQIPTTNAPFDMHEDSKRQPQNQSNRNYQNEQFNQNEQRNENEQFNQNDNFDQPPQWDQRPMNDMPDNRGPPARDQGFNNFGQGGPPQFGQGSNSGPNQFGQNPNQFGQGLNQFGQGPNSGPNQFGQGPNQFGPGPNSGPNQFAQGPNLGLNQFGPGPNQFGPGPNSGPNQFGPGPNSGPNQFGQGPNLGPNQFGQGPNSGPNQFGQGPNSGPNMFGQGPNPGPNQFSQGPNSGPNKEWQGNPGSNQNRQGPNQYNQGPRGNPMNGRMGDNFDNRPQPFDNMNQQQFGNFENQNNNNNFRGRGRGNFGGGPMRARGRGRF